MPDKSSSSKPPRQVSLLPFLFFFLPMFVERVWLLECWLFASVYLNNVFLWINYVLYYRKVQKYPHHDEVLKWWLSNDFRFDSVFIYQKKQLNLI
jgi:hypothetical protein